MRRCANPNPNPDPDPDPDPNPNQVRAALRDERSKMMPFRYADLGEMLSLGDSAGKG